MHHSYHSSVNVAALLKPKSSSFFAAGYKKVTQYISCPSPHVLIEPDNCIFLHSIAYIIKFAVDS